MNATILISPKGYDDVNAVLQQLGGELAHTHQLKDNELSCLADRSYLGQFGHIFLNCHGSISTQTDPATIAAIRDFVERGGALYASDWASALIEAAFTKRMTFHRRAGNQGTVRARVTDPYLAHMIGWEVPIHFDMDSWDRVQTFPGSADVYLWDEQHQPLALGFRHGQGRVVFTSYHHHAQRTEAVASSAEGTLLHWLVTLPTQHQHLVRVSEVLTHYRVEAKPACLVAQIASGTSEVIPLGLKTRTGVAVLAMSWKEHANVRFSVSYLRDGRDPIKVQMAAQPPLVLTARDPLETDAVEVHLEDISTPEGGPGQPIPYVLGSGIRRQLLGEPDWFALSIMRHVQNLLGGRKTLQALKELITIRVLAEIAQNILDGAGYSVGSTGFTEGEIESAVLLGHAAASQDDAVPDLSMYLIIPKQVVPAEQLRTRLGARAPRTIEPYRERIHDLAESDITERLLVALACTSSGTTIFDQVDNDLTEDASGWHLVSRCESDLDFELESVTNQEFLHRPRLHALIYRWDD